MADYTHARRHLMKRDPKLAQLIRQVGACRLGEHRPQPPFVALAYSYFSVAVRTTLVRISISPATIGVSAALSIAMERCTIGGAGIG
jgi:hypothetical protein